MITRSITVATPRDIVWKVLSDGNHISAWMNGARVETNWQIGAAITFIGEFHRKRFFDRGQILEWIPPSNLVYSYFSEWWRVADRQDNYSTIAFSLAENGNGTALSVTHEGIPTEAALNHARFFWMNALADIAKIAEGVNQATP